MRYVLPTFNILVNIFRAPWVQGNPPDLQVDGNLCLGRRVNTPFNDEGPAETGTEFQMWLLLPRGTDIRNIHGLSGADVVEVPAWSGRYYGVVGVDDAGGGFANEHRVCSLEQFQDIWPLPYPDVTGPYFPPPPPPGPPLLMDFQQTFGVPALSLTTTLTTLVTGTHHVAMAWWNSGTTQPTCPTLGLNFASPYTFNDTINVGGGSLWDSVSQPPGVYSYTFTFPLGATGLMALISWIQPAGVGVDNGTFAASNLFGISESGNTLMTSAAPGNVIASFGSAKGAGVMSAGAPFTMLMTLQEAVTGGLGGLEVMYRGVIADGIFPFTDPGWVPTSYGYFGCLMK